MLLIAYINCVCIHLVLYVVDVKYHSSRAFPVGAALAVG